MFNEIVFEEECYHCVSLNSKLNIDLYKEIKWYIDKLQKDTILAMNIKYNNKFQLLPYTEDIVDSLFEENNFKWIDQELERQKDVIYLVYNTENNNYKFIKNIEYNNKEFIISGEILLKKSSITNNKQFVYVKFHINDITLKETKEEYIHDKEKNMVVDIVPVRMPVYPSHLFDGYPNDRKEKILDCVKEINEYGALYLNSLFTKGMIIGDMSKVLPEIITLGTRYFDTVLLPLMDKVDHSIINHVVTFDRTFHIGNNTVHISGEFVLLYLRDNDVIETQINILKLEDTWVYTTEIETNAPEKDTSLFTDMLAIIQKDSSILFTAWLNTLKVLWMNSKILDLNKTYVLSDNTTVNPYYELLDTSDTLYFIYTQLNKIGEYDSDKYRRDISCNRNDEILNYLCEEMVKHNNSLTKERYLLVSSEHHEQEHALFITVSMNNKECGPYIEYRAPLRIYCRDNNFEVECGEFDIIKEGE